MAIREVGDHDPPSGVAELYRSHAVWLRRIVRRSSGHLAEDVVQETFLRISRRGSRDVVNDPRALLLTIARNVSRSLARLELKRDAIYHFPEDFLLALPDQIEAIILRQTIRDLPEIYRDVFVLSRFQGLTYEQIAQARGISVKTVEWRMTRALALCAASLRD